MVEKLRLVVDSNVLISRLLFRQSVAAQAVRKAMATHRLIVSTGTLQELEAVLSRPKFDTYLALKDRRVRVKGSQTAAFDLLLLRPSRNK